MSLLTVLGPHQAQTIYVGLFVFHLRVGQFAQNKMNSFSVFSSNDFAYVELTQAFCIFLTRGLFWKSGFTFPLSSFHPWMNTIWAQWYSYLRVSVSSATLNLDCYKTLFWRQNKYYSITKDCLFFPLCFTWQWHWGTTISVKQNFKYHLYNIPCKADPSVILRESVVYTGLGGLFNYPLPASSL